MENQLSGSLPSQLGLLANLTDLTLYQNKFAGSLPPSLGRLTNLLQLDISDNRLVGTLPTEIGNMSSLVTLYAPTTVYPVPCQPKWGFSPISKGSTCITTR
jgi:hypothetical protein